mmetsp:Transcript_16148/g.45295  ORF Transcript_16148/g.45295 Transcript_16148/m.45295 type:complete len:81 (+) Transcript_16148:162-404(+)
MHVRFICDITPKKSQKYRSTTAGHSTHKSHCLPPSFATTMEQASNNQAGAQGHSFELYRQRVHIVDEIAASARPRLVEAE